LIKLSIHAFHGERKFRVSLLTSTAEFIVELVYLHEASRPRIIIGTKPDQTTVIRRSRRDQRWW